MRSACLLALALSLSCEGGSSILKEPESITPTVSVAAIPPGHVAILNTDTGEIEYRETPGGGSPACSEGPCAAHLGANCTEPFYWVAGPMLFVAQCQTGTVKVLNGQCGCVCMGHPNTEVWADCTTRWLVTRG